MSAWVYVRLGFGGMSASFLGIPTALTAPTDPLTPTDPPDLPPLPDPPDLPDPTDRATPTGCVGGTDPPPPVVIGREGRLSATPPPPPEGRGWSAPPPARPRPLAGAGAGGRMPRPFRPPGQRRSAPPVPLAAPRGGAGGSGRSGEPVPRRVGRGKGFGVPARPGSPIRPEAGAGALECETRRAPQRGAGGWIARAGECEPAALGTRTPPRQGSGGAGV